MKKKKGKEKRISGWPRHCVKEIRKINSTSVHCKNWHGEEEKEEEDEEEEEEEAVNLKRG